MSLPDQPAAADCKDVDPLLAFNVEPAAAVESAAPSAESPAVEVQAPATDASADRQRIEQFERTLNRALTEIAALKSDQATLVAALDDLRKRQSRRPDLPPAVQPAAARSRPGMHPALMTIAAVVVLGAAMVATALFIDGGPPPETAAPVAIEAPEPVAAVPLPVAAPPALELVTVAATAAPRPRVPQEPERAPSTPTVFVGTLSIDASPGGRVFINRSSVGETPVRAEKLRAGSHLVWIERDGYRKWTRVVTVSANSVSRVFADLEPLADRR